MSDSQRPADEQPRDMATRKLSDPNATVNLNADEVAALQAQADKATRKLDNPFATVSLSAEDAAALREAAAKEQAEPDKATRKLDNPYATTMLSAEDSAAALRAATQSAPATSSPADTNPGLRGGAVANQPDISEDRTAMYAPPAPSINPPSQPSYQPPSAAAPTSQPSYQPPSAAAPTSQPSYQPYNATPPATQGVPASQPNAFPATPVLSSAPANNRLAFILMGLGALLIVIAIILSVI